MALELGAMEGVERLISGAAPGRGKAMHTLASELYPIARSITGDGVRQTLARLGGEIPMDIQEVPSGSPALDWTGMSDKTNCGSPSGVKPLALFIVTP